MPVTVEIDREGYRVIRSWRENDAPMPQWRPLAEVDRIRIEDVLEQVEYWKWDQSYSDPHILDGTIWSIKVRGGKTGGRRKNCDGMNEFPQGWDKLQAAIMKLAN
jgi:hypothetical protein